MITINESGGFTVKDVNGFFNIVKPMGYIQNGDTLWKTEYFGKAIGGVEITFYQKFNLSTVNNNDSYYVCGYHFADRNNDKSVVKIIADYFEHTWFKNSPSTRGHMLHDSNGVRFLFAIYSRKDLMLFFNYSKKTSDEVKKFLKAGKRLPKGGRKRV